MDSNKLLQIFISSVFINNVILARFLGLCPFVALSKDTKRALAMSMAVTFVTTSTSILTWLIYRFFLIPLQLTYLRTLVFILIIAAFVQLVEMVIRKKMPVLYRAFGIYLVLITTNCAVLGLTLFMVMRKYTFTEAVVFGFAGGLGFSLALLIMSGIREELEYADVPEAMKGVGITLVIAGMLALAFMGFAGLLGA